MKKYVCLLPFIIAMLSVFIKEQTIYTRIIFATLGLLSLTTAILQTKELKKSKMNIREMRRKELSKCRLIKKERKTMN